MSYRSILKQSLKITWRYKFLWPLGLLVAFLGNGGEYEVLSINYDRLSKLPQNIKELPTVFQNTLFTENFVIYLKNLFVLENIVQSLLVILLILFSIWLIITAQAALIKTIAQIIQKRTKAMRSNWLQSRSYFKNILLLNILAKGGIFASLLFLIIPIFILLNTLMPKQPMFILGVILFFVFTPVAVVISFLVKYAVCYIVLADTNLKQSLIYSLRLFRQNWLITFEIALILFIINSLLFVISIILSFIAGFPLLVILAVLYYPAFVPLAFLLTILSYVFILMTFFIGSLLSVFQYTAWIKLFLELNSKKQSVSKLIRALKSAGKF